MASPLRLVLGHWRPFGVDGLGRADLAEQLVGVVLVQEGQQLLPGGQLEQVNQPAGAVAQHHGALEALAREGAGDGLAGELADSLVGDHLEPLRRVEQQGGIGEDEVVDPLLECAEQDHGGGRGAGMGQVAAGVEAGHLADGLGQGIGQAAGRVGGQGEESGAELVDEPRRAVATPGAGTVRRAQAVQDDGRQAGTAMPAQSSFAVSWLPGWVAMAARIRLGRRPGTAG